MYLPDAKVKLLSVNSLGDVYPEETVTFHPQGATMSGVLVTPTKGELISQETLQTTFQLHTPTNFQLHTPKVSRNLPSILSLAQLCLNHSGLQSQPQSSPKGTSTMHHRLGHMDFKKIQFLIRTGVLANTEATKSLHTSPCKLTTFPLCAACQFGKQRQRLSPGMRS